MSEHNDIKQGMQQDSGEHGGKYIINTMADLVPVQARAHCCTPSFCPWASRACGCQEVMLHTKADVQEWGIILKRSHNKTLEELPKFQLHLAGEHPRCARRLFSSVLVSNMDEVLSRAWIWIRSQLAAR